MQSLTIKHIPATHWWKLSNWELQQVFVSECGIIVPKGFITDGLSIPFGMRAFFNPTGVGFNASIVHDHLIKQGHLWSHANNRFKEQLEKDKVPKALIIIYVASVRVWGFFKK